MLKKISQFYLIGYLIIGGLVFALVPQFALRVFLSNVSYDDAIVRLAGVLLLGLAAFVILSILRRDPFFLQNALIVRTIILLGMGGIYLTSENPLFLVLIGIVGLGYILSWVALIKEN